VVTIFSQILKVMSQKEDRRSNREGPDSNPSLHAAPQTLTRLLLDEGSLTERYKFKYKEVFDKFQELVDLSSKKSPNSKLGHKIIPNSAFDPAPEYLKSRETSHVKTFSPLELVATATLIAVHGQSRTAATLIDDVKEMRLYLRRNHKDLRLNNQCWATVWKFIDTEIIKLRGDGQAVPGRGVATSADEESSDDELVPASRRARVRLGPARRRAAATASQNTTATGNVVAGGSAAEGESTATGGREDTAGTAENTHSKGTDVLRRNLQLTEMESPTGFGIVTENPVPAKTFDSYMNQVILSVPEGITANSSNQPTISHSPYIIPSPSRLADTRSDSGGPVSRLTDFASIAGDGVLSARDSLQKNMDIGDFDMGEASGLGGHPVGKKRRHS
jgi:hypothetical protein